MNRPSHIFVEKTEEGFKWSIGGYIDGGPGRYLMSHGPFAASSKHAPAENDGKAPTADSAIATGHERWKQLQEQGFIGDYAPIIEVVTA